MKLWEKTGNMKQDSLIEKFTVGNDPILDKNLLKYDCLASKAHVNMLESIGILSKVESVMLTQGLDEIMSMDAAKAFDIFQSDEDCHTAIENYLIKRLGDAGKKIHTLRSRNDQVLAALRLYEKAELEELIGLIQGLMDVLLDVIRDKGKISIPGYTHMQKAMPTTIGMWLNSFVDSLNDDLGMIDSVSLLIDQNPLGSAAGFGVPVFKVDKAMTTGQLGFSKVMENPMYCQMSRGKFEAQIINVLSTIVYDINKLATDLMLFSMQEFGFVVLPSEICTGSSIMPQKKNPDVLELLRAKYHVILSEEFKVKSMIGNLMSGYNRDLQLTKGPLMNSMDLVRESLEVMSLVIKNIDFDEDKCKQAMTEELYATQQAYELVKKGMTFRDAYRQIGRKYCV